MLNRHRKGKIRDLKIADSKLLELKELAGFR